MRQQWQLWKSDINSEQCESLISLCSQYPDTKGKTFGDSDVRESTIRWINHKSVRDMLLGYASRANREVFGFDLVDAYDIQFTEYHGSSGGFYGWHHDVDWQSDRMMDRKLSVVVQLSDPTEYEGGEFQFKQLEQPDFKPRGSVIVFPSYQEHQVTPVTSGTRYSLVTWVEGPRWK